MTGFRRWLPVLIAAVWLACMAQIILSKLYLSNDISKFVTDSRDARVSWIGRQLADSELTKTTILVVGTKSGDRQRALAAADALAETLAANSEIATVRRGWDPAASEAIHDLYFPRRFYFAAENPASLDDQLSDEGLERFAHEVAAQLHGQNSSELARDPLLLYPAQLERLEELRLGPTDGEGRFITEDGQAVLFLTTVHSPFDFDSQRPLQDAITQRFAELDSEAQAAGDDLILKQNGVARLALQTEAHVREDIQRISTISIIGVIVLFLLLFRSPRMLLLSMLPLAAGFMTATGIGLLVFGELHVLTLAFGASLIGVCIDYPIHLFTHQVLYPRSEQKEMLAGVRPGLLLGALTTIAGFLGMGWAPFPGIREISVFAALGILAALATTLYVLPAMLPEKSEPPRSQRWMLNWAQRVVASMMRSRRALIALPLCAVVIMIIGLPRVEYEDDVSVLAEGEPESVAEEEEVRKLVSRMDGGRAIAVFGEDEEEALLRNAEVYRRLGEAVADGELTAFRTAHGVVWPMSVQSANHKQFCSREHLSSSVVRAYVAQGLTGDYTPFIEDMVELCRGNPEALDWATVANSALGPTVAPLRLEYGRRKVFVTYVAGVENVNLLRDRMAGIDGVLVFDQRSLMTALYSRHRNDTAQLVGLGLLAVMVILFARHRDFRSTLAAFIPSILAAGMTLGLLALMSIPVTLMHVVGLVLVLSMGVDYGVFLTESRGDEREVAATIFSLLACCMSTVLSIGLLGLSSNPGLQALGLTTGIGVLFSLILAPTALVVLGVVGSRPTTMSGRYLRY